MTLLLVSGCATAPESWDDNTVDTRVRQPAQQDSEHSHDKKGRS